MSVPYFNFRTKNPNETRKTFVSMEVPQEISPGYQLLIDEYKVREKRILKNYGVKIKRKLA